MRELKPSPSQAFKPALIAMIPTQKDAADAQFALLDPAFQQAISTLNS
jgi:hypothetical protein